jgi:hypothetical protein
MNFYIRNSKSWVFHISGIVIISLQESTTYGPEDLQIVHFSRGVMEAGLGTDSRSTTRGWFRASFDF